MKYSDYIWDLGGTLLDNYSLSAKAFEDTLKKYGKKVSHEDVYRALKVSTADAIQKYAQDLPNFLKDYKELEKEYLEHPILFDDAKKVLEEIKKSRRRNFMISHRDRHVLEILEAAGIADYFTEVVTSEDGFERKPSPQSINYLVEKYNLEHPVMIGDRDLDIQAGKNAGIATILFDENDSTIEANHHIRKLKEILDI